jgi:septal ring-binding cell division protein DamX
MMVKSTVFAAILMSLAIGTGTAWAEDAAAPSKMSAADKKAISKSCSDQANAKGLHGKERKHFRSECKRHGGKAE